MFVLLCYGDDVMFQIDSMMNFSDGGKHWQIPKVEGTQLHFNQVA